MEEFYSKSILTKEFIIYEWRFSWQFPFLKKFAVFKGNLTDAQKKISEAFRSTLLK